MIAKRHATLSKRRTATRLGLPHNCFSQNLRQLVDETGISLEEISKESGLDLKILKKIILDGTKPSRSVLQALSCAPSLNLSYKKLMVWYLLDESLSYANDNHCVLQGTAV